MRVVLYTGKGGVGKTTTSAATAIWAAERGCRTLVASADAAHSLGDVLEADLGAEPRLVAPNLHAAHVDARAEAERHWGAVRDYLVSIFRHQGIEEVVADELAVLPGAEEVTTLLAVDAWARDGRFDLVVVDCAPTDSALRLLTFPEVARGALRLLLRVQRAVATAVTPLARNLVALPLPDARVFADAEDLLYRKLRSLRALVTAPQTTTRLVVTPERMVIDEALRAHTDFALFDLRCDAVVMNRLLPAAAASEDFFREWMRVQEERLAEVEQRFAPLPVLRGPFQDDEVSGPLRLSQLGRALFQGREPDAIFCREPRLRFQAEGDGYRAWVPLPHASAADLEVAKVDDRLVIGTGQRRRTLPLPRRIAHLDVAGARLESGALVVRFGRAPEEPASSPAVLPPAPSSSSSERRPASVSPPRGRKRPTPKPGAAAAPE